jgi:hypothetical protein
MLEHLLTIQKQYIPNEPHGLLQELQEKPLGNYLEISTADNLLKDSKNKVSWAKIHHQFLEYDKQFCKVLHTILTYFHKNISIYFDETHVKFT